MNKQNQIAIFQATDGQAQVEVRFQEETIWLSQKQMAELFEKDTDTIGLHLKKSMVRENWMKIQLPRNTR